jgi:hypothetical protein
MTCPNAGIGTTAFCPKQHELEFEGLVSSVVSALRDVPRRSAFELSQPITANSTAIKRQKKVFIGTELPGLDRDREA